MAIFLTVFSILIISIVKESWCDIVTVSSQGKNYDFNVTAHQRKVFLNVPVWTVDSNSQYNYEGIVDTNGVVYEDLTKKAILFKKNDCNVNCWEGVFGLGTKRNVIDNIEQLSKDSLKLRNGEGIYRTYPAVKSLKRRGRIAETHEPLNEAGPYFMKLLVAVDYSLFQKLGNDVKHTVKYLNIFWSTVDIQYRNITSPNIEVRITGVIIGKNDKAFNYINKNLDEDNTININQALFDANEEQRNIIRNTNITNYDAVFTMTGLNGFIKVGKNEVKVGSNGVSFNGSICLEDYHYSVITDDGGYYGIHNAIHELGHLLGLDHDAVPGNAMYCFPVDYRHKLTVMWPRFEVKDIEYWSTCSLKALQIFVKNVTESWCLRSEVHERRLSNLN